MRDAFGLSIPRKVLVASFRITCYTEVFVAEAAWYACYGRKDEIGEALGACGRSVTDAFADILKCPVFCWGTPHTWALADSWDGFDSGDGQEY